MGLTLQSSLLSIHSKPIHRSRAPWQESAKGTGDGRVGHWPDQLFADATSAAKGRSGRSTAPRAAMPVLWCARVGGWCAMWLGLSRSNARPGRSTGGLSTHTALRFVLMCHSINSHGRTKMPTKHMKRYLESRPIELWSVRASEHREGKRTERARHRRTQPNQSITLPKTEQQQNS